MIPKAGDRSRRLRHRHAGHPGRGSQEAQEAASASSSSSRRRSAWPMSMPSPPLQAQRVAAFRRRRLRRQHPRAHDPDRRPEPRLMRILTDKHESEPAPVPLGRHVALCHRRAWWSRPRQRPAPDRRPVRRLLRSRRLSRRGQRAAVLGCEGKWAIHPIADRPRQRDHGPVRRRSTKARRMRSAMEQASKEGKGACQPRRPADRHRLDPPGRGASSPKPR